MADDPAKSVTHLSKVAVRVAAGEPVRLTESGQSGDRFLIYSTDAGIEVRLRYEGDGLWMTQAQMAELFGVDVRTVNEHLLNIYADDELDERATLRKFRIVRAEGSREVGREVNHYTIDAVISVGYRISSRTATLFRRWATDKLVQFATKGFVVDVERLKAPAERDHFRQLREIIRDIRAAEANVYRELRDIVALCSDYAALDEHRKHTFFATVQNKLHYAVTGMTGAEIRTQRASAGRQSMGLTTWSGQRPVLADTKTAKNFLAEPEIRDLNRFTNMLLDYFEQETELHRLVSMADAERALDKFITSNERPLLIGAGRVSKEAADEHCRRQYAAFDSRRKERLQHDDGD